MAELKGKQKKLDANKDGKISGEDFSLLRERKALGGLASKLANRMKNFFSRERKDFSLSIKDLVEEYDKLTPKQRDKKFNDITRLKDKDFDMFMINDVMLSDQERAFVKQSYPNFEGDTPADVYKHTKSGTFVEEMYDNNIRIHSQKEAELDAQDIAYREANPDDPTLFSKGGRVQKQEGKELDDQMNALAISVSPAKIEEKEINSKMLPDEEMEEEYVDYVVESTLDNEDKNYLNAALEKDAKLSEIFDQVVESATEFTGSGPVEGPGTGRSDSIPARLSDGEFVFTAKATEEIGADNLRSMMKEAEAAADKRQDMANGGMVMEEETIFQPQSEPIQQDIRVTRETVGDQASMREEEDLIGKELKKSMLSTAPYVRS